MRKTTIRNGWGDEDEAPPAPLTREQAQALRSSLSSVSPRQVVAAQIAAGLLVSLLCWGVGGRSEVGLSALYGAACIVVPTAVLAAGIARLPAAGPAAAAVGFMVWEGVKMLLTLAMLVAAVKVVPHLSWPALLAALVALVACLSMNWLALSRQGRTTKTETGR